MVDTIPSIMGRNGVTVGAEFTIIDSVHKFRVFDIVSVADRSMQTKDMKSRR